MATPLHQLLPPKAIILQQLPLQGRCLRGAEGQSGETERDGETDTELEPEMCHSKQGPEITMLQPTSFTATGFCCVVTALTLTYILVSR